MDVSSLNGNYYGGRKACLVIVTELSVAPVNQIRHCLETLGEKPVAQVQMKRIFLAAPLARRNILKHLHMLSWTTEAADVY
jgi:hypothetical protein